MVNERPDERITTANDEKVENNPSFFENREYSPWAAEEIFSPAPAWEPLTLDTWDALKSTGILPHYASELKGSDRSRLEFLEGARLLGLNTKRKPLHPQMLYVADMLGAENEDGTPTFTMTGVLMARRSAKTTSILCMALGRCALRDPEGDEYLVGFTLATTGAKARTRFLLDVVGPLERLYPDPETRPFVIRKAAGSERIVWPQGSLFSVLTPSGEAFRSDAFSMVILDESGEASVALGEDLMAGALATTDTRPDAQFVIAGTAGAFRKGQLLWDTLEDGRNGVPGVGIVEYSAPEPVTAEDYADLEIIEELARKAHPGIGTLTTIQKVMERHRLYKEKPASFLREYLSIFGQAGAEGSLFDFEAWQLLGKAVAFPTPPANAALAVAVHPERSCASVAAAWREPSGKAHVLILRSEAGINWLTDYAGALAIRRKTPIVHDEMGEVNVIAERWTRLKPKPRTTRQNFKTVKTATALFLTDVDNANLVHYAQPELDEAIQKAVKRMSRGSTLVGRRLDADNVTPIEAALLAVHAYDAQPIKKALPRMTL